MARRITMFWTVALAAVLLTSCSANYFCKHCQSLGGIKTDSTSQVVELKVPEVKADTTIEQRFGFNGKIESHGFSINIDSLANAMPDLFNHDTVYVNRDRLHIKIVPGKTIYVSGKCD